MPPLQGYIWSMSCGHRLAFWRSVRTKSTATATLPWTFTGRRRLQIAGWVSGLYFVTDETIAESTHARYRRVARRATGLSKYVALRALADIFAALGVVAGSIAERFVFEA